MIKLDYDKLLIMVAGNGSHPFNDMDLMMKTLKEIKDIDKVIILHENNCHQHILITFKKNDLREYYYSNERNKPKRLALKIYEKIPQLKPPDKANLLTIQKPRFDLIKYQELEQEEQKYYNVIYITKEYNDKDNRNSRIYNWDSNLVSTMCRDYWMLYKKITQTKAGKKIKNAKDKKNEEDKIKEYFQENRPKKKLPNGEVKNRDGISLDEITGIVAKYYRQSGKTHTIHQIEGKVLMLMGLADPKQHSDLIINKINLRLN